MLSLKIFPYVCLKWGLMEIRLVALALFRMNKRFPFTKTRSPLPHCSPEKSVLPLLCFLWEGSLEEPNGDREFPSPFLNKRVV